MSWANRHYLVETEVRRAMDAGARQFMITGIVPDPRVFVRR